MVSIYHAHIVGAKHHPPALAILDYLPYNALLILRAEPDNAYDPNAIQVLCPYLSLVRIYLKSDFNKELEKFNYNLFTIAEHEMWQLGYAPRTVAEELTNRGFPVSHDVKGKYYLEADNKPRVSFSF